MRLRLKWTLLAVCVLTLGLIGCQSGTQQPEQPAASTETPAATPQKKESRKRSESATAAPAVPTTITVPAGTALEVRLASAISSGTASAGSSFQGTLASALSVEGSEIAPIGSTVAGSITNAVSSGRLNRPAELSLTLTSLTVKGGDKVNITTSTWSEQGESHKKRDILAIGGGAAAGALIGALAGGKKGAAIGTAIGGGGGTGVAAATGKKEIELPAETKLTFKLTAPLTLQSN